MAYDKIISVHTRLDRCIKYVLNREKTDPASVQENSGGEQDFLESERLETAINCGIDTAYKDMMATKQRWGKQEGVQGYHLIHSYAPGEVTPFQAHQFGVEFAQRLLGDRFEAVVSTHLDRGHLHCHIVFNSVSLTDGKKFRNDFASYYGRIRVLSNTVSKEHGLSVIEPQGKGKHYSEWKAEKTGKSTVRGLIRKDIDAALARSFTYRSFLEQLRRTGYSVKCGANVKHTAVCPPGGDRYIRLSSLGSGYTEEDIKDRLSGIRDGRESAHRAAQTARSRRYCVRSGPICQRPRKKLRGFQALYVRYLYLLGARTPAAGRQPIPFQVRKEVIRLNRYVEQFRFLQANGIHTQAQLEALENRLQGEIDTWKKQRERLCRAKKRGADVQEEIQEINRTLRPLHSRLKSCRQILQTVPRIQAHVQVCRKELRKERENEYEKTHQTGPDRISHPGR